MSRIDHRILMAGQGPQLADPLDQASKAMGIREAQIREQAVLAKQEEAKRAAQRQQAIAQIHQNAVLPDGTIDQKALMTGLAQGGFGDQVLDTEKALLDNANKRSEISNRGATTKKTEQEVILTGLKQIDGAIASLAARPDVNERMVMSELGRLVSSGAFNAQAAMQGVDPDTYAREMANTMPVGNPMALKQWLIQAGLRTADASKRLEAMLPKFDEQDRGGVISEGTVDQLTGQRTAGPTVQKSNTPGEQLAAATSRRGQDLANARATEANEIQRQASRTQIVTGQDGQVMLVDKGTGLARPASELSGRVVEDPTAGPTKNRATAARVKDIVPLARQLLEAGPTASGIGAKIDNLNNYIGIATESGDRAQALEALGGWFTSNMPRMEGPQSNYDVANYQTMAGRIGDRTLPVSTRLEALKNVEALMQKYSGPQQSAAPRPGPGPTAAPTGQPSLDDFFITR